MIRCTECGHTEPVSEDDPDATLDDMVWHIRRRHGAGHDAALKLIEEVES